MPELALHILITRSSIPSIHPPGRPAAQLGGRSDPQSNGRRDPHVTSGVILPVPPSPASSRSAPPSGYLDGVDRTIKYQAKPGAAVKRKKQYAQVKPYFNY